MEEKDKLAIRKHYLELVHRTELTDLLPRLIENGVFSQRIAEPYQNVNRSEMDRKRDLFCNIQRRGPAAFERLLAALRQSARHQHAVLACLLEGGDVPVHSKPARAGNNLNHNRQNIIAEEEEAAAAAAVVVVDEGAHVFSAAGGGAAPFALNEAQRPHHIRQLSQESPHLTIDLSEEPLRVLVRRSEHFCDGQAASKVPLYRTRGRLRGAYLAINNMEFVNDVKGFRTGAQVDEENLKELFKQMGFSISTYRNQTRQDMLKTVKDFANARVNPVLRKADCLVVAIMSHGEEGETKDSSQIVTSDGSYLPVAWVLEQFNNINCPEFQNKPKIFIFQICRGSNLHPSVTEQYRTQHDGRVRGQRLRNTTDMLIAYSTLPGDKSYRDIYLGTWYIQLVCKVFMEHACDTDVEHLLKIVDEHLGQLISDDENMQTSTYESRAFKRCYLHPGLYE